MILLDTDVVIDILRRHPPAVAWIRGVKEPVCLPGYVAMELFQGCLNKRQVEDLRKQLSGFALLWPDEAACRKALDVHATAWLTHALGILDALIGATAVAHGVPLYTFNTKHFAGYPGLRSIEPYGR